MKHLDHAAMVPIRFTDALRAGEIDGVHYLLGVFLTTACYECKNTSGGIATVRLSGLVELLGVRELLNLSEETIRRKLRDLEPEWIECEVAKGQRAWRIRLTGLASPAQAPAKLHRSSTRDGPRQWNSTSAESSTDAQSASTANPHSEGVSAPSQAPLEAPLERSEPPDTRPDPSRPDQRLTEERLESDRSEVCREVDDEAFLAELEKSEEEKVSPAREALESLREVAERSLPAGEHTFAAELDALIAEGVLVERGKP